MSDDRAYKDGDIVWVKLGNHWWPGEVTGAHRQPEGLVNHLKRKPYCVVKFFQEDAYEYVKNAKQVYPFQCSMKDDFIAKGLKFFNLKKDLMEKFPADVKLAEKLTLKNTPSNIGGNTHGSGGSGHTLIINDRPDSMVKAIFSQEVTSYHTPPRRGGGAGGEGSGGSNTSPSSSIRRSRDSVTKILNITSQRFGGGGGSGNSSKYVNTIASASITSTPLTDAAAAAAKTVKQSTFSNDRTPWSATIAGGGGRIATPQSGGAIVNAGSAGNVYRCHLCDFTSLRQNVIIFHRKSHSSGGGDASGTPLRCHPSSITLGSKDVALHVANTQKTISATAASTPLTSKRSTVVAKEPLYTPTTASDTPSVVSAPSTPGVSTQRRKLRQQKSDTDGIGGDANDDCNAPATTTSSATVGATTTIKSSSTPHNTNYKELTTTTTPVATPPASNGSSGGSRSALNRLPKKKELAAAHTQRILRSSPHFVSDLAEITLPATTTTTTTAATTLSAVGDNNSNNLKATAEATPTQCPAAAAAAAAPVTKVQGAANATPTVNATPPPKRNVEEIRQRFLADWSDEEKEDDDGGGNGEDDERKSKTGESRATQEKTPVVGVPASTVATTQSSPTAMASSGTTALVAVDDCTTNNTVMEGKSKRIRNIPKKDRRDVVLREFNNEQLQHVRNNNSSTASSSLLSFSSSGSNSSCGVGFSGSGGGGSGASAAADTPPIVNLDSTSSSSSSDSVVVVEEEEDVPMPPIANATPTQSTPIINEPEAYGTASKAAATTKIDEQREEATHEVAAQHKETPAMSTGETNHLSPQQQQHPQEQQHATAGVGEKQISCFDFEEDDDENSNDILTSIANFKKQFYTNSTPNATSPEKSLTATTATTDNSISNANINSKQAAVNATTSLPPAPPTHVAKEQRNGLAAAPASNLSKNDEQLSEEIETLLAQTTTSNILMADIAAARPGDAIKDDEASVKALPIKERGKRIFKSRNRSSASLEQLPTNTAINCGEIGSGVGIGSGGVGVGVSGDNGDAGKVNATVNDGEVMVDHDDETTNTVKKDATNRSNKSTNGEHEACEVEVERKSNGIAVDEMQQSLPDNRDDVVDGGKAMADDVSAAKNVSSGSIASEDNDVVVVVDGKNAAQEEEPDIPLIRHAAVEIYRKPSIDDELATIDDAMVLNTSPTLSTPVGAAKEQTQSTDGEIAKADDLAVGNAVSTAAALNAESGGGTPNRFNSPTDENSSAGAEFGSPTSMLDDDRLSLLGGNSNTMHATPPPMQPPSSIDDDAIGHKAALEQTNDNAFDGNDLEAREPIGTTTQAEAATSEVVTAADVQVGNESAKDTPVKTSDKRVLTDEQPPIADDEAEGGIRLKATDGNSTAAVAMTKETPKRTSSCEKEEDAANDATASPKSTTNAAASEHEVGVVVANEEEEEKSDLSFNDEQQIVNTSTVTPVETVNDEKPKRKRRSCLKITPRRSELVARPPMDTALPVEPAKSTAVGEGATKASPSPAITNGGKAISKSRAAEKSVDDNEVAPNETDEHTKAMTPSNSKESDGVAVASATDKVVTVPEVEENVAVVSTLATAAAVQYNAKPDELQKRLGGEANASNETSVVDGDDAIAKPTSELSPTKSSPTSTSPSADKASLLEAPPSPPAAPATPEKVRINVDIAHPLSSQIADILANTGSHNAQQQQQQQQPKKATKRTSSPNVAATTTAEAKDGTATNMTKTKTKSTPRRSPSPPLPTDGAKKTQKTLKRKPSFEADIPSFVIERSPKQSKSHHRSSSSTSPVKSPSTTPQTSKGAGEVEEELVTIFDIDSMPILLSNEPTTDTDDTNINQLLQQPQQQQQQKSPKSHMKPSNAANSSSKAKKHGNKASEAAAAEQASQHSSGKKKKVGTDERGNNKYVILKTPSPTTDSAAHQQQQSNNTTAKSTEVAALSDDSAFSIGSNVTVCAIGGVGNDIATLVATTKTQAPHASKSPSPTKPKSPAAAATGGRKHAGNTITLPSNASSSITATPTTSTTPMPSPKNHVESGATTPTIAAATNRRRMTQQQQQQQQHLPKQRRLTQSDTAISSVKPLVDDHRRRLSGGNATAIGVLGAGSPPPTKIAKTVSGENFAAAQQQLLQLKQQQQQQGDGSSGSGGTAVVHHLHNRKPRKQPQQHRGSSAVQQQQQQQSQTSARQQQQQQQQQNLIQHQQIIVPAPTPQEQQPEQQQPTQQKPALQQQSQQPQPPQQQQQELTTADEEQLLQIQSEEQIDGTSNILAVPTQPIPGYNETFLLCTLVNNNYKPIDNVPLYLDHDLNQLVPVPLEALDGQTHLIVQQPPPVEEAQQQQPSQQQQQQQQQMPKANELKATTTSAASEATVDASQQPACLLASTEEMSSAATKLNDGVVDETVAANNVKAVNLSEDVQSTLGNVAIATAAATGVGATTALVLDESGSNVVITSDGDDAVAALAVTEAAAAPQLISSDIEADAAAVVPQMTAAVLMPTTDGNAEIVAENAVILNLEGQQIILDAATFAHLIANPDANTQLITDDGTEFVLTREAVAALQQQDIVAGVEQSDGIDGGESLQVALTDGHLVETSNATDILAVALAGSDLYGNDVLQIETPQGLQLMSTDGTLMFHHNPQAPNLASPHRALTSETNALIHQTPIMSTLEKPSSLAMHNKSELAGADTSEKNDRNVQTSGLPVSLGLPVTVTDSAIVSKLNSSSSGGASNAVVSATPDDLELAQYQTARNIAAAMAQDGRIYNDPGS